MFSVVISAHKLGARAILTNRIILMNNMLLDWLTYLITAVIVLSILLEGKTTRYPSLFFYGSLLLLGLLLVVAGANWWFYHSAYGLVIVLFTLLSLVCTRFRLVIYACRFKNIVKQITKYTEQGHRVIMVLPEPEEEKNILLAQLRAAVPEEKLLYTPFACGPGSDSILKRISELNTTKQGYLLVCEGQVAARSWLSIVENGDPDSSIAVNFHSIPDME